MPTVAERIAAAKAKAKAATELAGATKRTPGSTNTTPRNAAVAVAANKPPTPPKKPTPPPPAPRERSPPGSRRPAAPSPRAAKPPSPRALKTPEKPAVPAEAAAPPSPPLVARAAAAPPPAAAPAAKSTKPLWKLAVGAAKKDKKAADKWKSVALQRKASRREVAPPPPTAALRPSVARPRPPPLVVPPPEAPAAPEPTTPTDPSSGSARQLLYSASSALGPGLAAMDATPPRRAVSSPRASEPVSVTSSPRAVPRASAPVSAASSPRTARSPRASRSAPPPPPPPVALALVPAPRDTLHEEQGRAILLSLVGKGGGGAPSAPFSPRPASPARVVDDTRLRVAMLRDVCRVASAEGWCSWMRVWRTAARGALPAADVTREFFPGAGAADGYVACSPSGISHALHFAVDGTGRLSTSGVSGRFRLAIPFRSGSARGRVEVGPDARLRLRVEVAERNGSTLSVLVVPPPDVAGEALVDWGSCLEDLGFPTVDECIVDGRGGALEGAARPREWIT